VKTFMAVRLGTAIAALLTAGVFAAAQGPGGGAGFGDHRPPFERAMGPHGNHGRWWNDPVMVEKLKLTDEQRKAMDGILFEHREKLIDMRAAVDKAELEMEPLMRDDQPNEARILAQIDKVAQARAELEKANARFLLALRGKLTPEQWKTLQADRANRHGDRGPGGWQGRGEGRGPGGPDGMRHRQPPPPPGAPDQPAAGPQSRNGDDPGPDGPPPAAGADQ